MIHNQHLFLQFANIRQNLIKSEVQQLQDMFHAWVNTHKQAPNSQHSNETFLQKQLIFDKYIEQLTLKINSEPPFFQFQTVASIRQFFDNLKQLLIAETKMFDEIQSFNQSETQPDQRGHKFSKKANFVLKKWFIQNYTNPFPTDDDIKQLSKESGLSSHQINIWFINARGRIKNKFYMNKKFKNLVKERFYSLNLKN